MTPHELMVHQHMVALGILKVIGILTLPVTYIALYLAVKLADRKEPQIPPPFQHAFEFMSKRCWCGYEWQHHGGHSG